MAAQDPERQKEVSDLLGTIESEEFSHLVTLGKMMVDFSSAADAGAALAPACPVLCPAPPPHPRVEGLPRVLCVAL